MKNRAPLNRGSPVDEDISLAVGDGNNIPPMSLESTTQNNKYDSSSPKSKPHKWYRGLAVSSIIALAYLLNLVGTGQDMRTVEEKYETVINPAYWFYINWLVVYILELIFVLSQLIIYRLRNSPLIQKQIPIPWIAVQISVAGVLFFLPRGWVATASFFCLLMILGTAIVVALCIVEFRRPSTFYRAKDYILVLLPFWYLLGQLIVAGGLFVNVQMIMIINSGLIAKDSSGIAQLATALVSLSLILTLGLIFACIPSVRNGVVQIPLVIGLTAISWRLIATGKYPMAIEHLAWVTPDLRDALGVTIYSLSIILVVAWLGAIVARCRGYPQWYPMTKKSKARECVSPSSINVLSEGVQVHKPVIGTSNSFRSIN